MPKSYQLLPLKVNIRESKIFAKSIVTDHSRKYLPEIPRIFYLAKLCPLKVMIYNISMTNAEKSLEYI